MSFQMIVTVKQVPDTQQISGEAMTPEGTVNRSVLPAIVNPEDLNALEEALKIKDRYGGHITVISMGPPSAAEALKECYYRGADKLILLSDRKFAGSDTLATSLTLAYAIKKIGHFDIVFCGRQAIDGDTAQVGPQLAEKLSINQITGITSVLEVQHDFIKVERSSEYGFEYLKSPYPVLISVTNSANDPRSPSAARMLGYARMKFYRPDTDEKERDLPEKLKSETRNFQLWDMQDIGADPLLCGLKGSPTMVKKVENIVLEANDIRNIDNSDEGINSLIHELLADHIIG
jgi:electron transfer flavoprotein beta subunit